MAKEIERKFLVKHAGWRTAAGPGATMRQGYLAAMDDRTIRIRLINGESARLTIKIGTGMLTRDEFEYEIPLADGEELIASAIGTVIAKTRYRVQGETHVWEVDVFEEPYAGLIVAEVEMQTETDSLAMPDWIGEEVTDDRRYSNFALATQRDKLRPDLTLAPPAGSSAQKTT
ncbi:adenylate cyclase [Rhizobium sp. Leaf384]|uniref:CYTH domain-containing protein n=1 Tax=unclassified Rhizobium TaxID=2613769 RepID=UPI00071280FE|nr:MULTISPECIES: CYTH domain-containing protein [unclassified Rhizobium]KQS76568.1 adenylate cyclase [Rhizobium sp. Leaf383]KQS77837.1 adenylate cyclase [Rhizobium sp. Leaf384]